MESGDEAMVEEGSCAWAYDGDMECDSVESIMCGGGSRDVWVEVVTVQGRRADKREGRGAVCLRCGSVVRADGCSYRYLGRLADC